MRTIVIIAGLTALPLATAASTPPTSVVFHDPSTGGSCGVHGSANSVDPALNALKNRIEPVSTTTPASVADLRNLPSHEKAPRAEWSASDLATFSSFERTPIHVVGYLVGVRPEGAESTNCGATDRAGVDFHTWLVDEPDQDKTFSAVAEVAPRWRQTNPAWTAAALQALVEQGAQVRITGWRMYDEEHPEQVGKTRSTLWEIHPVTDIEVATNAGWIELGDDDATKSIHNTAAMTVHLHPAAAQYYGQTAQLQPREMQQSPRERNVGRLFLVHTRSPAFTPRVLADERQLFQDEDALGE